MFAMCLNLLDEFVSHFTISENIKLTQYFVNDDM